ncbi:hypothetical protein E4T66_00810 [Sinimarinibacterium sp. CAU 1509]|uniref:murein hydrolase activator EnvC family protein n=1 Tax=Sinimarinibacterium sp. CAU 1509 TaxID=2562283 RepID=UPI0010AD8C27|nr:peptidoglycan DD-metalloendopeptidase family protein [Sinimarinibacterium sp. CAU 1509]TJY64815.1 hypothetical protein E4T66_00810 [Sinimarinibacterium sp. CAU 1509]
MNYRAFLCGLSLLPAAAAMAASGDIKQNQASLDQIRSRIQALSSSIENTQSERDSLARDVQKSERRVAELESAVKSLKRRSAEQQKRIDATRAERTETQSRLQQGHAALAQQMRAAYVVGRQAQTQLLLNQSDVQQVGRMLVYYDYLQRAQTKAMAEIASRIDALAALAERLQAEQDQLLALQKEQQDALDQLRKTRKERAQMLDKLKQRIRDERGELKRMQAEEKSVRDLIQRLQDALSDLPPDVKFSDQPFAKLKGKLPWPVRGKLIARFGDDKAAGKLSWKGHWIDASEGTSVRAVARGRVVYVGWLHRYGLIVLLEHEGSYYTLYGHAQSTAVAVGDAVSAGQVIAAAGNTGGHDRSGVYFELRKGTEPIDPSQWLVR